MTTLFTYGSLMFPAVWRRVSGEKNPASPASLEGWVARRVIGDIFPVLVAAPGHTTRGLVYHNVSDLAQKRLDAFEGSLYRRVNVVVTLDDGGALEADTYALAPAFAARASDVLWEAAAFEKNDLQRFLGTPGWGVEP
jgi:gamma-glutamylcyclotransferase (GGCT)/AIG2-like uncharacterized protein YtfP